MSERGGSGGSAWGIRVPPTHPDPTTLHRRQHNNHKQIHSKKKVPVGRWVHVAARFDSEGDEGGKVSVFMDGNLVASQAGSRRPGSREEFAVSVIYAKVVVCRLVVCIDRNSRSRLVLL